MYAQRFDTTISPQGELNLPNLPFEPGAQVEVIILRRESPRHELLGDGFQPFKSVTLRGQGPSASEMVKQDRA